MIELFGTWLMTFDSGFDVLRYLTVRTIGGTLTALMLSIFLGPTLIRFLTAFNLNVFTIVSSSFMVITNVICNYLFIEKYGVSGIALSTSIVVLTGFLIQYTYVLNKFKFNIAQND